MINDFEAFNMKSNEQKKLNRMKRFLKKKNKMNVR